MPPKSGGLKRLSQKEIASLLGLTSRQVFNLVESGMPRHGADGKAWYDGAQCVAWYLARKLDEQRDALEGNKKLDPHGQLAEVKAQRERMRLDEDRGNTLTVDYATSQLARIAQKLRDRCASIPSKWAPRMLGLTTVAESKVRLREVARELQAELAGVGADDDLDQEGVA